MDEVRQTFHPANRSVEFGVKFNPTIPKTYVCAGGVIPLPPALHGGGSTYYSWLSPTDGGVAGPTCKQKHSRNAESPNG